MRVPRAGSTMLEMLALVWAFAIVLMLGTVLLVGVARMEQASVASLERLTAQGALADQFRADVGQAVAAPDRAGDLTAGPACLILRMADGKEIAYRWEDKRLERVERGGPETVRQQVSVGPGCMAVTFERTGRGVVVLRLMRSRKAGGPVHPQEIWAALGGDLR